MKDTFLQILCIRNSSECLVYTPPFLVVRGSLDLRFHTSAAIGPTALGFFRFLASLCITLKKVQPYCIFELFVTKLGLPNTTAVCIMVCLASSQEDD